MALEHVVKIDEAKLRRLVEDELRNSSRPAATLEEYDARTQNLYDIIDEMEASIPEYTHMTRDADGQERRVIFPAGKLDIRSPYFLRVITETIDQRAAATLKVLEEHGYKTREQMLNRSHYSRLRFTPHEEKDFPEEDIEKVRRIKGNAMVGFGSYDESFSDVIISQAIYRALRNRLVQEEKLDESQIKSFNHAMPIQGIWGIVEDHVNNQIDKRVKSNIKNIFIGETSEILLRQQSTLNALHEYVHGTISEEENLLLLHTTGCSSPPQFRKYVPSAREILIKEGVALEDIGKNLDYPLFYEQSVPGDRLYYTLYEVTRQSDLKKD